MIKLVLLAALAVGPFQAPQARPDSGGELTLPLIQERIARTSPEGLEVIEKAKWMTPQIQKHISATTLGAEVQENTEGRGRFIALGWEAVRDAGPRWTVSFYFKDEGQRYAKATWSYNEEKRVLLPAEFTHTMKFWVDQTKTLRP
jgi:hypothetical protein